MGSEPVQPPVLAVSVEPDRGRPEIAGREVFVGTAGVGVGAPPPHAAVCTGRSAMGEASPPPLKVRTPRRYVVPHVSPVNVYEYALLFAT
jgi:hypothetical protein